jgi:maleylpyruvate isomerase
MILTEVGAARESIEWTHERLRTTIAGLTDAQVGEPSALPEWTRGHVLAHLVTLAGAAGRQLERALAGEGAGEFYDGGQAGREALIQAGAGATAQEHVGRVGAALDRMEGYLDLMEGDVLARPTAYRGRPCAAVVLLWWRETSIHLTDLRLGAEHTLWGAPLREHLVSFLTPRVPAGVQLDLAPTDVDEPRRIGDGEVLRLRGTANDLVAWLAGRAPLGEVTAHKDGTPVALPELGPWP